CRCVQRLPISGTDRGTEGTLRPGHGNCPRTSDAVALVGAGSMGGGRAPRRPEPRRSQPAHCVSERRERPGDPGLRAPRWRLPQGALVQNTRGVRRGTLVFVVLSISVPMVWLVSRLRRRSRREI